MERWVKQIIEQDRQSHPEKLEGMWITMGPSILFESINTQISIAKNTADPKVILIWEAKG
jgi:hypothetical protein